ncbi:hypothetical protein [Armatimonas rosea]|uniref:Uncharacterized protein n=1 Tax=Armatimonas rosea TaxID=685828 RepID=A0A7W9W3J5_ARMRO|nr:hypothetical protein [Armatimonas rosea]MBB6048469.1 hypothetical protein [Armatimonas rosea]
MTLPDRIAALLTAVENPATPPLSPEEITALLEELVEQAHWLARRPMDWFDESGPYDEEERESYFATDQLHQTKLLAHLILLKQRHAATFSPPDQARLETTAQSLCVRARFVCDAHQFYDPEPYLQALAVLRFLGNHDIQQDFEDAAHEWIFHEWGCGAHLSHRDELLTLLSLFLTLDTNPPRLASALFQRLIRLEENIACIYGYIDEEDATFRKELHTAEDTLFAIFARLGLAEHLPPFVAYTQDELLIPCFDGAVARMYRTPKGVLKTYSHHPLIPKKAVGLPPYMAVSCYSENVREGFSRWTPGLAGMWETWTLQRGGVALALRSGMDRSFDYWHRPDYRHPIVHCHVLCLSHPDKASCDPKGPTIQIRTPQLVLPGSSSLRVLLWAISMEGPIENEPTVAPARVIPSVPRRRGEEAWDIDWVLPGGLWKVRVDPLAKEPLCGR